MNFRLLTIAIGLSTVSADAKPGSLRVGHAHKPAAAKQELADIKAQYEKIDHIFFKDYFGQVVVSPPFGT